MQAKFDVARSLFSILQNAQIDIRIVSTFTTELIALEMQFALSTSYLYIIRGESNKIRAAIDFARIIVAGDYVGTMDRLVDSCVNFLRSIGVILRDDTSRAPMRCRFTARTIADIQRIIDIYPRGAENITRNGDITQHIEYDKCPVCGSDMAVDAARSELHCYDAECGALRELIGTVFDDSQFYSQEGQKAKSGTFNPNRHFQFWWMHILAREPEEEIGDKSDSDNLYGEKILTAILAIVTRDHKVLRLLTVNDIRAMLREIGRTDLNKNVPLIMKKLTGVGPPQISDALAVRVENLFTKAIEIGEKIRRSSRVNRNYYPYYIYKILDQLLEAADHDNRRVLYYIYVQSKETVEIDDADWEQICAELVEISYVPTDRTKALKYRPL